MNILKRMMTVAVMLGVAMSFSTIDARMTDEQVIQYVRQATAEGKSQQQIGKELMARGVTSEQVDRLKSRMQSNDPTSTPVTAKGGLQGANTGRQRQSAETLESDVISVTADEIGSKGVDTVLSTGEVRRKVFGQDVFNTRALSFEPNENMATPQNYVLGPGDEVIIDIWGANEDHIRQTISPEGSIMVSQVGPVYLNGKTITDANRHLRDILAAKYAGVSGEEPDSEVSVTLGNVRSIQVDIMGEVNLPGTYRLSPFSSVFHAIYKAGGINDIGTMRNIRVVRDGRRLVNVDIYKFLFEGKQNDNIRLQEGDVIIIPPYETLVSISGNVKRPMYYEMKPHETLADLIEYAGGFTGGAYTEQVRLARQSGRENELFNIVSGDFGSYPLNDGDEVNVGTILDRYANRVEVKGAVMRPGMFAIASDLLTVGDLIRKADGLQDDAYTGRALLYREGPDLALEIESVDIDGIISGHKPDINLHRNDVLVIPSVRELSDQGDVLIAGLVAHPGSYPYAEGITIEDLVVQAGGLLRGASTARVDVSRRLTDTKSMEPTNQIAETFSFGLKDGLVIDGTPGFQLQPYDVVEVRRSPGYQVQRRVNVSGEVVFDGGYTLQNKNERVSQLIKRAGGLTPDAYVRGAHIKRQMTPEEIQTRNETLRLAMQMQNGNDSIIMSQIELPTTYNVAIDLAEAMRNPMSEADIVLKEGDQLMVPEFTNTVRVTGNVMFPNTVMYKKGKKLSYYIDQAGGYGDGAKKSKAYIVYLNGSVAKVSRNVIIEPGCQIVVPSKQKGGGIDWTKILSIATSFGSVATMAAALANLFK